MFSTKGYDATSVREICEAAEVTKPTLHHFYRSKEGVYQALVEGALQEYKHRLVRQVEGPGSPQDRLKAIARDYFAFAQERRELVRFIFALVKLKRGWPRRASCCCPSPRSTGGDCGRCSRSVRSWGRRSTTRGSPPAAQATGSKSSGAPTGTSVGSPASRPAIPSSADPRAVVRGGRCGQD